MSAATSRSRTRSRREIIHEGLTDERFIANATSGYEEYAASVEPYTLEEGERLTGVPAAAIRELAHAYGRADRAILCWTLGITEHHNAVDNVLALINLCAADRPRRQVRVGAQSPAGAEQRAGRRRHGRDPEQAARVPGHREERRGESAVRGDLGRSDRSQVRLAPDADVRGDGARRAADAVRDRREPGATPKPTARRRWSCSRGSTSSSSRTSS